MNQIAAMRVEITDEYYGGGPLKATVLMAFWMNPVSTVSKSPFLKLRIGEYLLIRIDSVGWLLARFRRRVSFTAWKIYLLIFR